MSKSGKLPGFCVLLFLIAALLGAEFYVRKYYGVAYYLPERNFWRLDLHTDLGGQFDGKEKFVLKHTGVFFDEEVTVKKPAGVTRVIVLGTSSTEGFRLAKEDNFPSQLQRLLDRDPGGGKFEVINAGVGGYVSYQLLVYFQEVLLKLSPDIVILYLASNDLNYNGPFTARDYYKKAKEAVSGPGNDHGKKEKLIKYGLNGFVPWYPFLAESRLFGYIFIKINEISARLFLKPQLSPPADREYVLGEFASLSRQHHFKLIFAPELLGEKGEVNVAPYHVLMESVAKKEGVPLADMSPILREYPEDEVFLDNKDYVHLNPFGCRLVGEKLFEQIKALTGSVPQTDQKQ